MEEKKASTAEIKALYRAASAFRKAAPWEWMDDDEIIGVQDSVTGKTGYCCVLGAMGEIFALVVYIGEEGLDMHLKLQNNEIAQDDPDLMFMQKCLIASFENRGYLDKEDITLIKRLNLSFRENLAAIPAGILVRKKEVAALFEPCAASLQIGIKTVKRLDEIENARRSFEDHLRQI